jgi:pimeloyl-ACP methyl ester carboxylesterase
VEHDGPTVLLETGMGGASMAWAWVQPRVAERATVVAYDRAGLGWSDPSPRGPGAEQVVRDLREALAVRGLSGPYVLVGHSLGGHYMRAFAAAHPTTPVLGHTWSSMRTVPAKRSLTLALPSNRWRYQVG